MSAAQDSIFWPERYRLQRQPCDPEYREELSQISAAIEDPVAKLRYLRAALDREDDYAARVAHVPYGPIRRALYRLRGLNTFEAFIEDPDSVTNEPIYERAVRARQQAWLIGAGSVATVLLIVPAVIVGIMMHLKGTPSFEPVFNAAVMENTPPVVVHARSDSAAIVAETLPVDELGVAPTTIWLADRGADWELYSNGLRIETTYSITGEPRRYRVHDREKGLQKAVYAHPAGILFHTSESDLWPLEADYEHKLRRGTIALLRYVQKAQSYNYLIDRFGRVYRVVDDDSRANHAGHSIWARGDDVYLDLNSAFVGVSFESRWEGGRTLPITRAQLSAGRNLTNYLRQRFAIPAEMCVTHGLTSVSPRQHLIGYHRDWARGFPFAAFGLPDLYAQPPPSIALFGFSYDNEFLRSVGERWPGLVAAEQTLLAAAKERGITVSALRRERQARYQEWSQQIRSEAAASIDTQVPQSVDKRG